MPRKEGTTRSYVIQWGGKKKKIEEEKKTVSKIKALLGQSNIDISLMSLDFMAFNCDKRVLGVLRSLKI